MKTSKIVTVKTDESSGDGYIDLKEFSDFVDISKVASYSLDPVLDENKKPQGLILKFFDADGKELKKT